MASFAYVTSSGSRTVSVLDTATHSVVAASSIDGAPLRLAVIPDGKRLTGSVAAQTVVVAVTGNP
jgi:YVTN family beta-propeller protein